MAISDVKFTNNNGDPLLSVILKPHTPNEQPTRRTFLNCVINFEGDDIIAYLDTIRVNWIKSEAARQIAEEIDADATDEQRITFVCAFDYDQNHSPLGTNREMIKCFGVIEQSSLIECLIAFAKWGIYFIRTNHLNDAAFRSLIWHGFTRLATEDDQRSSLPAMVDELISVVGPADYSGTPSSVCPVNEVIDMGIQRMPSGLDPSLYGPCPFDRDSVIPAPTFVHH